MGKRPQKKAKAKRKAKHYPRMDAYRDAIADLLSRLNAMGKVVHGLQARVNRIETVLGPQLSKLVGLQEPDTPETVAEKAKQARDVMTKAADALGG